MSRELARTVGGRGVAWAVMILAIVCGLAVTVASAETPTPTPTPVPAPILTYSKVGSATTLPGGVVSFTITATNSGNAASNSQTMRDTLPAGMDWGIVADSWGCTIAPSSLPGRVVLDCDPVVIVARHLNAAQDAFVNGSAYVTVSAVANVCGPVFNTALFNGITPVAAAVDVVCPATPTPTPTATSVPTQTPTQTPTPVPPTPTATQVPPTATSVPPTATNPPVVVPTKPQGPAPRPPNTGNTTADGGLPFYPIVLGIVMFLALMAGVITRFAHRE